MTVVELAVVAVTGLTLAGAVYILTFSQQYELRVVAAALAIGLFAGTVSQIDPAPTVELVLRVVGAAVVALGVRAVNRARAR